MVETVEGREVRTSDFLPFSVQREMKSKLLYRLGSLLSLLLFVGALCILDHELKDYSVHDILQTSHNLSGPRLFGAFVLTLLNYLIMTGYDTLALSYIQHPLGYRKIALASFISYAMSNNLGIGYDDVHRRGGSVVFRCHAGSTLALGLAQDLPAIAGT